MARVVPDWVKRANRNKAAGLKHGFRSGLEEKIGGQLEAAGIPVLFETFRIEYVIPESRHHYTHDFRLPSGIIVEGKGIFDSTDRAKHQLLKVQYPELDIRFVFSRSKAPITPGSKTTLAMWCERYGFKYADKLIPPEWLREKGPKRQPEEVIKDGPYGYVTNMKKGKT